MCGRPTTATLEVINAFVLLRRSADAPELTGEFRRGFPGEAPYLVFRYQVVRVWQEPAATFLQSGGLVPLAPLSAVTEAELPALIQQMDHRIHQEARTADESGTLWTATRVLMGLRWPRSLVQQLLRGVHGMKESPTYQAIVEEGIIKDRQDVLLQQGRKKFGPANEATITAVRNITDFECLSALTDRILDVSRWEELLGV